MKVHVTAPLRPTEAVERVEKAVSAFWPDLQLQATEGVVEGTGTRVDAFRDRVWELRIIDSVRGQMLHRCKGPTTTFWLSKQAALHDKISFPPAPQALGEIDVTLTVEDGDEWPDAEALVWWLCPETADGEIVA